jgi:hypothetical protein
MNQCFGVGEFNEDRSQVPLPGTPGQGLQSFLTEPRTLNPEPYRSILSTATRVYWMCPSCTQMVTLAVP